MRVLFVVNSVKAKFPVDLAEQFKNAKGCDVHVFTLLSEHHSRQTLFQKVSFLFRIPAIIKKLRAVIIETKPDILHTHFWLSDIIGALAARPFSSLKLISTQHDEATVLFLIRIIKTRSLRRFHKIIAISTSVGKFLQTYFKVPAQRIAAIYNGIDLQKFSHGITLDSTRRPVIGFIARLEPIKGGDIFIEALSLLEAEQKHSLQGVIIGDGSQKETLEKRVQETGLRDQIIFRGEQADLIPILQILDIVVVPSRSEGLSVTILEALSAKKLVIASRVGGIPELIQHGQTGLLVPPNNPKALSETIGWAMSNPKQVLAIRERGHQWLLAHQEQFDINNTIAAYIRTYENL